MNNPAYNADGSRSRDWLSANREAHSLAQSIGMNHGALSDYACSMFGVASMGNLSTRHMRKLCAALKHAGGRRKRKRATRLPNGQRRRFRENDPDALPTPEQTRFIMRLFEDLEGLKGCEISRPAFVRSVLKNANRAWPQTRSEAAKIIEGLKGWIGAEKQRQFKN